VFQAWASSEIIASVTANFATARWLDVSYLPTGQGAGYVTENAELSYHSANRRWIITAFVDNLSNRAVYTSANVIGAPAPNGYSYYAAYIDPPRMFGVRLKSNF
jgi:iron complex outermembrane receptor protein